MRNLKLMLGIAAFVAVMGLLMVSCKEDPPSAPAPDAIFNLSADYGAYPEYPITATVIDLKLDGVDKPIPFPKIASAHNSGTGEAGKVVIFWVKTDALIYQNWLKAKDPNQTNYNDAEYINYLADLNPDTGGQNANFYSQLATDSSKNQGTTSTEGRLFRPVAGTPDKTSFIAGIVDSVAFNNWKTTPAGGGPRTDSFPQPLFAKPIEVVAEPTDSLFQAKKEFLGKWTMSANYAWVSNDAPAGTTQSREIVKIGPDTFRIFLNQPWVDKGETKGNEGIQFAVTTWKQLTSNSDLTRTGVRDPNNGNLLPGSVTFLKGFDLEIGTILLNQGYTDYTTFSVFKDSSSANYLARGNQNGTMVRSYLTRTPPTDAGIMTEDWAVTGDSNYTVE